MASVFVIISETMPVNGTYPASGIESVWSTEDVAWVRLSEICMSLNSSILSMDDTIFYDESFDPEKYEYIEYRIEEHTIQSGE